MSEKSKRSEKQELIEKLANSDLDKLRVLDEILSCDAETLQVLHRFTSDDIEKIRRLRRLNIDDLDRLKFIEHVSPGLLPLVSKVVKQLDFEVIPPEVTRIMETVSDYTWTGWENIYCLCESIRYLVNNDIPGDIVECGVWKGGSIMAAALMLDHLGCSDREIYLFDTFTGMSPATEVDIERHTGKNAEVALNELKHHISYPDLDEVKKNVSQTPYPWERFHFVKGKVEDTLPSFKTNRIALLRLDTDWYESTKCELEYLYPHLCKGGVLIIDDYGHYEGAHKAVDEYIKALDHPVLLNRIDYTARVAVKNC